jgi:hypothetical protein
MAKIFHSLRSLGVFAGASLLAAGAASPTIAAASAAKPVTIQVPATAFPEPSSKLCMQRTMTGKSRKSHLSKTVCQTREEWSAQGVTFVLK